jgi:hypothetical protein
MVDGSKQADVISEEDESDGKYINLFYRLNPSHLVEKLILLTFLSISHLHFSMGSVLYLCLIPSLFVFPRRLITGLILRSYNGIRKLRPFFLFLFRPRL